MSTIITRSSSSTGSGMAVEIDVLKIFVDRKTASAFQCCVCSEVTEQPKQCENIHMICRNCVDGIKKAKIPMVCPVCKSDAPLLSFGETATAIESLETYCPTTDKLEVRENCCNWTGPYIGRNWHEKVECDFSIVQCKGGKCVVKLPRRELAAHKETTCDYRKIPCTICSKDFQIVRLAKHKETCEEAHRLMECEHGCGALFAVKDEEEHNEHCPMRGLSPEIAALTIKLDKTEQWLHNMSGKIDKLSEENASLREQLCNLKTVGGAASSSSNGPRVVDLTGDEEHVSIKTEKQAHAARAAAEEKAQRVPLAEEAAREKELIRLAEIETEKQAQADHDAAEETAQREIERKVLAFRAASDRLLRARLGEVDEPSNFVTGSVAEEKIMERVTNESTKDLDSAHLTALGAKIPPGPTTSSRTAGVEEEAQWDRQLAVSSSQERELAEQILAKRERRRNRQRKEPSSMVLLTQHLTELRHAEGWESRFKMSSPVSVPSRKRERSEERQTSTTGHHNDNNYFRTSPNAANKCFDKRRRENDAPSWEEGRSAPCLRVERCILVGTDGYDARKPLLGHQMSCVNRFEQNIVWRNSSFVDAVTRRLLVAWVSEADRIKNNVSRIETLLLANKLFHIAEQFDSASINSMREGDVIRGSDHFFGLYGSVVAVYLEARIVKGSLMFIAKCGLYSYEIVSSRVVMFSKPIERSLSRGMSGKRCFRSIALHNKFRDNTVRVLFTFDLKRVDGVV